MKPVIMMLVLFILTSCNSQTSPEATVDSAGVKLMPDSGNTMPVKDDSSADKMPVLKPDTSKY